MRAISVTGPCYSRNPEEAAGLVVRAASTVAGGAAQAATSSVSAYA